MKYKNLIDFNMKTQDVIKIDEEGHEYISSSEFISGADNEFDIGENGLISVFTTFDENNPLSATRTIKILKGHIDMGGVDDTDPDLNPITQFNITTNKNIQGRYTKLDIYSSFNIPNGDEENRPCLNLYKAEMNVYGTFTLSQYSRLKCNSSDVCFYQNSVLNINGDHTHGNNFSDIITISEKHRFKILGTVNIDYSCYKYWKHLVDEGYIDIDNAAVENILNIGEAIEEPERTFTLNEYIDFLRSKRIGTYTQGTFNTVYARLGYKWSAGDPQIHNQVIQLIVSYGEAILGDLKLKATGIPINPIADTQLISGITVEKYASLYIADEFKGETFVAPKLYLGVVIDNNTSPANLDVYGDVIVSGSESSILCDRGGYVHIHEGATITLKNGAEMQCTNSSREGIKYEMNESGQFEKKDVIIYYNTLIIDGTLIIDHIEQIKTFSKQNISFGPKGKIIILNPHEGVYKNELFSIPDGIKNTDLYRMFYGEPGDDDYFKHLEYHIPEGCGIKIDKYFENYSKEMTKWFGNERLEEAIYNKHLVWDNGGYIELNDDTIPWVSLNNTLYDACKIFKTTASYPRQILQDVADRLVYAGCGNITFRIVQGTSHKEIPFILDGLQMKSIHYGPDTDTWTLLTKPATDVAEISDGELFIKNRVAKASRKTVLTSEARSIKIINNKAIFKIPE